MDENGNRENGRHKQDHLRSIHAQWMMPQHQMKDHHSATIKFMALMAERDSALNERDLAISEKKTAIAERDMALFQRDAAINERNSAIIERDNAIAALEYSRGRNISHYHHHQQQNIPHSSSLESSGSPYNHRGEIHINEQINEPKAETVVSKKSKQRKNKRSNSELNNNLKPHDAISKKHRKEWKVEDLGGLNEVIFDESSMPVPVCSCTGKYQPCYKWGNGGWQSACCTTTISMYPLPVMPNKRHARVNGRKMSGSVFTKLLSKLASEGHDLSMPLDLKDHWSKHGTNRYITIK